MLDENTWKYSTLSNTTYSIRRKDDIETESITPRGFQVTYNNFW